MGEGGGKRKGLNELTVMEERKPTTPRGEVGGGGGGRGEEKIVMISATAGFDVPW